MSRSRNEDCKVFGGVRASRSGIGRSEWTEARAQHSEPRSSWHSRDVRRDLALTAADGRNRNDPAED